MCNCIKDIETRMREKYLKDHPEIEGITDCHFDNKWISLEPDENGEEEISLPLTIEYTVKTSKGKILKRKYHCNMTTTYCPMCGEKVDRTIRKE